VFTKNEEEEEEETLAVALGENHRLAVPEVRVLRKIFELERRN
jgi:hypothetical protein